MKLYAPWVHSLKENIVSIVAHQSQADSMLDEIIGFIEMNTEAEILEYETEVL